MNQNVWPIIIIIITEVTTTYNITDFTEGLLRRVDPKNYDLVQFTDNSIWKRNI